jgi:hypothetical protein
MNSASRAAASSRRIARPLSRRDSHAPTPIADRYSPMTSENWVTESPRTKLDSVAACSS